MNAKHTPGPWKVVPPGHGFKTQYLCVELDEEKQYSTLEMLPADAHLIAAAPELFEVAQNLRTALEAREGYASEEYFSESNWNPLAHVEVTITVADIRAMYAAIKKATGD